ncbi:MAG: FAD-dependent oxidoreductase [Limnohabitans sp.]|nr:FAD-dependent oxidoreductase [Limnohabitans sp.]
MKIAVIGAGIVGITTAFELAQKGHSVTVYEEHSSCAEGGSFANAGVLAPGYVTPWAAPGMPGKVLRYLFSKHAPVRVKGLGSSELKWIWQWLRACRKETYLSQKHHLHRLAFYSRQILHNITLKHRLDYEKAQGYMVLLRGGQEVNLMALALEMLKEAGARAKQLSPQEAYDIEPALNPVTKLKAAIYLPDDEVANCRQFAILLKDFCERRLGVEFKFGQKIALLQTANPLEIRTPSGQHTYEATVICTGVSTAQLLAPLGIKIPMLPVYGYSISAAIREPMDAPHSGLMDERYKVSISRLGQRVRIAGCAQIGGDIQGQDQKAISTLYKVLNDWFPSAARLNENVQVWKGARPMFANRPPMIGESNIPGLWLNTGHGSNGWALSCGSARMIADLMSGLPTEINTQGFAFKKT